LFRRTFLAPSSKLLKSRLRVQPERTWLVTPVLAKEADMGRGILLWLLGIPIPIIILLALFWH